MGCIVFKSSQSSTGCSSFIPVQLNSVHSCRFISRTFVLVQWCKSYCSSFGHNFEYGSLLAKVIDRLQVWLWQCIGFFLSRNIFLKTWQRYHTTLQTCFQPLFLITWVVVLTPVLFVYLYCIPVSRVLFSCLILLMSFLALTPTLTSNVCPAGQTAGRIL